MDIKATIFASESLSASLTDLSAIKVNLSAEEQISAQIGVQGLLQGVLATEEGLTAAVGIPDVAHEMPYTGDYVVTPLAHEQTVLKTKGKAMTDDVTVLEVPYYEISNPTGDTVYIASEV